MDKYIEYAPIIVVIIGFLTAYHIFVTPKQLQIELENLIEKFENKLRDYVLKETHDIAIKEIKSDILEIKNDNKDIKTTLNRIYENLIKN